MVITLGQPLDIGEGKIVVSEEIEKTGKRTREIKIQDNLELER